MKSYQSKWNSITSPDGRTAGSGLILIITDAGPAGSDF